MLHFLAKRLLWLLPTLWIISTVLFILTKILPGYGGFDITRLETDSFFQQPDQLRLELEQRQYLKRTGQDLPYFYFRVQAAVDPDTLDRIVNEYDRQILLGLTHSFGSWPLVSQLYLEVEGLKRLLHALPNIPDKNQIASLAQGLLPALGKPGLPQILKTLQHGNLGDSAQTAINRQILRVQYANQAMEHQHLDGKTIHFPVIRWHGFKNQYHLWFRNLTQGNLGYSFRDQRPVTAILAEALANTFWLMLIGFILTLGMALALCLFFFRKRSIAWGKPILTCLYIIDSIPVFLLALLLLLVSMATGLLSGVPMGMVSFSHENASWLEWAGLQVQFLLLPILCIVLASLPYVTGQIHSAMQQTLGTPYIIAAKARGLPEGKILHKHTLRNALLPTITLISDYLPSLIGGALVLEVIFAIPGVGRLLADSVLARDYPVIMGVVILVSLVRILSNILADVLYHLADPRINEAT